MDHDNDSHRMGLVAATAMSVTIVVGAGLLTLPGLSYAQAGRLGHLPWLLMSVLMLPLLAMFAFFARRHPSAGGHVRSGPASSSSPCCTSSSPGR